MHTIVGSCPRCGAPMWAASPLWSIYPPTVTYSCACFVGRATVGTTTRATGVWERPASGAARTDVAAPGTALDTPSGQ